jgi:hypothetical protein
MYSPIIVCVMAWIILGSVLGPKPVAGSITPTSPARIPNLLSSSDTNEDTEDRLDMPADMPAEDMAVEDLMGGGSGISAVP